MVSERLGRLGFSQLLNTIFLTLPFVHTLQVIFEQNNNLVTLFLPASEGSRRFERLPSLCNRVFNPSKS